MRKAFLIFVVLAILFSGGLLKAEEIRANNVLIIIDCSHQMLKKWGGEQRIDIVKKALINVINTVYKEPAWGFNVGIRVFGEKSELEISDCNDTRLASGVEWFDPVTLTKTVEGLRPKGKAPLSHAIRSAENDFPRSQGKPINYIVVVTTSTDDCVDGEYAAVNYIVNERGIARAIHFVGVNLSDEEVEHVAKFAETGKGHFANPKDAEELESELLTTINVLSRVGKELPKKEAPEETTD